MKITVVNGTEKQGVTYRLKEAFLAPFRGQAEITEFYLPRDCPHFCVGCTRCFRQDERRCKDADDIQKIEKALREADLLVFTSPAYVFHATGAMKALLDHLGYRWMPHRPAGEMFGKRAVIITQCLGAGAKSTARDIRHSLSWWGVSAVKVCAFRLLGDIVWERLPEKKRAAMLAKIRRTARVDCSRPARTGILVKCKFYAVRALQRHLGKSNQESADYRYWKSNGWLDGARPWRERPSCTK